MRGNDIKKGASLSPPPHLRLLASFRVIISLECARQADTMAVLSCGTGSSLGIEADSQELENLIQLSSELHQENTVKDDFKVWSLKGSLYRPLDFHLYKTLGFWELSRVLDFFPKTSLIQKTNVPCLHLTNGSLCFEHCSPYSNF